MWFALKIIIVQRESILICFVVTVVGFPRTRRCCSSWSHQPWSCHRTSPLCSCTSCICTRFERILSQIIISFLWWKKIEFASFYSQLHMQLQCMPKLPTTTTMTTTQTHNTASLMMFKTIWLVTQNPNTNHVKAMLFTVHTHWLMLMVSAQIRYNKNAAKFTNSFFLFDHTGHKRTVEYTADDHNGFNAVVHREPLVHKVAHVAAPVIHKVAAPVHYAEPHYAHAPIHHHY